MKSAFAQEAVRCVRLSAGRFIAIAVIAALGTGFYAGLRMTSPDMKLAADEYYDAACMSDIRVAGNLGLDDEAIEDLREIEGVEAVMPEYEADVLADVSGVQYAVRVHGFDMDLARSSDTSDGLHAYSDESDYLNRPILVEGSWPCGADECVLSADAVLEGEVEIGDTVSLVKTSDGSDLADTFEVVTYTVTGFVRSPYYVCSSSMGTTTLGDGEIDDFMMVDSSAFSGDLPYTGAFLCVEGARELNSSSEVYDELIAQITERLEEAAPEISAARLERIKASAQEELDEALEQLDAETADAYAQLDDAQAQLDDARTQLDSALSELASSQAQLDAAAAEIDAGQAELASGWQEYAAAAEELTQQQTTVYAQLDDAQAQLGAQETQVAALEAQLEELQTQLAQVEAALVVHPDDAALLAQREQLVAGIAQLEAQVQTARSQVDAAKEQLAAQRADADAQFAAAQDRLDASRQTLEASQLSFDQSKAQHDSGLSQYESGRDSYADGLAEYTQGTSEYEEQRVGVLAEIAAAQADIDQAQADVDALELPELYVLDRSKNIGAESYESDSNRIDQIARVFPMFFFLVAALVSLTTMTRMVEEERVLIGTYKALGYSNACIMSKYVAFALVASATGSFVGIVVLSQFLPRFIMYAYSVIYVLPAMPAPIDLPIAFLSAGAGIAITLAATVWAAAASLREKPAELMLPRAPKAGKRIFLERIKPLWARLSFSWKVTARNILRYKRRFYMAVVGVAGCTALLLTGFGLQNAINDIIDKQYGEGGIFSYDMTIRLDDDAAPETYDQVSSVIDDTEKVGDYTVVASDNLLAKASCDGDEEESVQLVVPQDADELTRYVTMRTRVGHRTLTLDDSGAIVSEKLASELDLEVGDELLVYEMDTIGNATGEGHSVTISGIMENYVLEYVYMTPAYYESVMGTAPEYDTFLGNATNGEISKEQVSSELLGIEGVGTVAFTEETIEYYRTALKSVNAVVVVLIVAAAVLAFVVLYNLTNINIEERSREIAALKVLGFTPREESAYIFREIIIISVIGALCGCLFGIWLEGFVVVAAEVDLVMFGRQIHAWSFVVSLLVTMGFTCIVTLAMRRKLAKISMVESLKSVD